MSNQRKQTKRQRSQASASQGQNQPPQKKRKTSNRQKRRRAKMGRAAADFALTGKGGTRNSTTNRKAFVVTEDEYIGEVVAAAEPAFNNTNYPVNPGLAQTFPWLSTIAKNFEKYQFEYLEFYYKREVSEFAANGQTGKVIYSFDTDAADPAPYGKQEMEATDPHQDGMPSENFRMPVPKPMLEPIRTDAHFVRSGAVPANTDIKTYDVGSLNVATQGTTANGAVGELHVRYKVHLMVPVIPVGGPTNVGALQSGGAAIAAATPFGSAPVATGSVILGAAATNVLSIANVQVGQEILVAGWITGVGLSAPSLGTLVGLTLKGGASIASATGGNAEYFNTFLVTALNPTVTVNITVATSIAQSAFVVSTLAPAPGF